MIILSVAQNPISAELHWKKSYRMGGGLLLGTSAAAVGILLLRFDTRAKIVKVKPTVIENTDGSYRDIEPSSSINRSQTSDGNITPSSGETVEISKKASPDVLQNYSLKYKSKTTYGPSNMKFVIPRKNRMYGSRETSVTSSEESVKTVSPDFNHLQNKERYAAGRTIYTNLLASRSPDSYGINQHIENKANGIRASDDYSIKPSQYNVLYSYNITQNMNGEMNNIELL